MRRAKFTLAFAAGVTIGLAFATGRAAPLYSTAIAVTGALSVALLWAPTLWLPLFTRLNREQLLEDGVRPRIYDLLKDAPGLGITDVCQRLEIGWGTAVHHLNRLERAGLVVSHDSGRRRRFFTAGEPREVRTALCVLGSDLNRRLVEHVRANPGANQRDVCRALGISAPLAHKYLSRLIRDGFVVSHREWRSVQYFPGACVDDALATMARHQGASGEEGLTVSA